MTFLKAVPATYLLLLPPPPVHISCDNVRIKYETTINAVLKQLTAELKNTTIGCTLDIALPVRSLSRGPSTLRGVVFAKTQGLLAAFYKLICVVAANGAFNVEDAEGIDIRVLLVDHDENDVRNDINVECISIEVQSVPYLTTLARSCRAWRYVFAVDGEEGHHILEAFLQGHDRHLKVQSVPGPEDDHAADASSTELVEEKEADQDHQGHLSVALGGTFDHLHIGHKLLLTMSTFLLQLSALSEDRQNQCILTVGITGDELLKNKKHADLLESWDDRQKAVSRFVRAIVDFRAPNETHIDSSKHTEPGRNGHALHVRITPSLVVRCVEISDPFGPTITDNGITALVVSAETRAGGKAVNEKRIEKSWPALEVFEVDVLNADTSADSVVVDDKFENKLSSTRIRQALSEKAQARNDD